MTKIKILLLIGIISILTTNAFSQTKVSLKTGISLAKMELIWSDGTEDEINEVRTGINIGIILDIPLSDYLDLETGIIFENKGYSLDMLDLYKDEYNVPQGKIITNINYFTLPINIKSTFNLGKIKGYALFGPYISYALSADTRYKGEIKELYIEAGYDYDWEVELGFDEDFDSLIPLDFGATLGTGIEINHVGFGVSYDLGLINLETKPVDDLSTKNMVFKFFMTYTFG